MTYNDELVIKAQQGDTEALNVLCVRWRGFVATICVKYCSFDEAAAEDAVQNTLIRVTHNIASFRRGSKFSTWLYTIARRACYDILKDRLPVAPECSAAEALSIERFEEHVEKRVVLDQVLAQIRATLTPQSYQIFISTYRLGMSASEISTFMGISHDAVRQRLSRIRKVVREIADVTHWGDGDV